MFDITAIGEALIDLTQTGLSASGVAEYAANPGGAPCVVADTNGAGDTFFGAFLSQMRAFTLDSLTIPQLRDMLGYANRAASWTTSRSGAIPAMPTAEEMRG